MTDPNSPPNPDALRDLIRQHVAAFAEHTLAPKPFEGGRTPIPPAGKVIGASELQLMVDAVLDGWLTTGRFNAQFDKRLANFLGVPELITVNSGSSANLLAFYTLTSPLLDDRAIQKGDEVITVAAGFPTTVSPIVQFGAIPVFVDIDPVTLNIDADLIEAAITPRTKAIMLAHTLGNPFDLAKVKQLADTHTLWLIEDCCDALGSTYQGKMVGTFGDIATLSFYPAHHITMGEGGAVFTHDHQLRTIAESLRDWGRDCNCPPGCDNTCGKRFHQQFGSLPAGYDHKYVYSHMGFNLKITDMQAACGLAQLDRLAGFIEQRKANYAHLKDRLKALEPYLAIAQATPDSDPSWFGFPITLKPECGVERVDLIRYLDQHKIGTRLLFAGNLTRQPCLQGVDYRLSGTLEQTDTIMRQTFWLGIYPALDRAHLDYVADTLTAFFNKGR
jgi:CDP-6-deoxy-D-xylo-4-hexulose-3-dehydrase